MPAWWEEMLHIVTGRVSRHDDLPDLRGLATRRVALEKTHFLVNDRERRGDERRTYVMRHVAPTRHDVASVAVSSNGRGVGSLPHEVAVSVAPILHRLGGAALINGVGSRPGSLRLWVDLPTSTALADFAVHRDGKRRAHDS
ncbi:hypothetical protein GCM10023065_11550 [Microbacterium laevaniformans]|uniref:Uncharacterized protein n=1 Tax=Microbacterium laevaniformans TaxID=36807 RepID=A0A150HHH6_9MICO|nr:MULTISPECIES: hypothetical protein [Microbacterium]KXZ61579.1 hypothetical protein Mlaev_00577 [Microbacterium laevaniformans]MBM7752105.1 hypothetical protein [Microbacterium laevaniformans]ODT21567.1 MAG: hypothetical protein ABS64_14050 [Microbacterium sp. SCN 69-37]OJU45763.1 MAG: hypothetical protein BGN98_13065 [Microbacterium sp. 69-7]GLJ64840.1 hypothetical protein GCM10017578_17290 [Microbacterium laevaniformans]